MENTICCIISTFPEKRSLESIAKTLLDEHLVACVQIGSPITSHYVWNGARECEREIPITLKTSPKVLDKLYQRYVQLHPYECPEWVVIKGEASKAYYEWVEQSCEGK